jgi:hypothetical protein
MRRDESFVPLRNGRGQPGTKKGVTGFGLVLVIGWLLGGLSPTSAQDKPAEAGQMDRAAAWEALRPLVGTWEAGIEGRLGQGVGRRRYEFIFDGLFLTSRHASVRLPQEKSPEGDYHRELAVYSFDRERGLVVLREFIVEGYVLRYTCQVEPGKFVCTTEEVENGPGMRARLTVEIKDRYRLVEIFELAGPGEELKLYFTNQWTRVPDFAD